MKTEIRIENLILHAYHGVMPQERRVGNSYRISLTIGYDFTKAMASDDIHDTLNYADVCTVIKDVMSTPSRLLENAAYRIVTALQNNFSGIDNGTLTLTKLNPPIPMEIEGTSVTVSWTKEDFAASLFG